MKFIKSISIAVILQLVFLSLVLAKDSTPIAVALTVKGKVEYKQGDGDWKAMVFGSTLNNEDQVRTGDEGFAAIAFTDDKSQVKLRPNSFMTVLGERKEDYSISKRINLEIGELYASVKKQKGSMKVATPTAVASVKGTEFWVILDENGDTQVLTLQGLVEFLNLMTGVAMDVLEGQIAELGADGTFEIDNYSAAQIPTIAEGDEDVHSVEIIFTDEDGNRKTAIIELNVE
ncbi:FecR domain-containing protein [Calditrichota bacterium]